MLIDLMGMLLLPHLHIQISSARGILCSPWPPPASPWLRSNRVAKSPSRPGASFPCGHCLLGSSRASPPYPLWNWERQPTVSSRGNWERGQDGQTGRRRKRKGGWKGSRDGAGHQARPQKESKLQDPKNKWKRQERSKWEPSSPPHPPFALRDMRATRPQPDPPGRLSLPSLRHQTQY